MAGANLGTAYITVLPSMKGARGQIASELGAAGSTGGDKAKKGFLGTVGGMMGGVGKIAAVAGGVITGALGGIAVTGGFNRAMQIEQAQAKLSGLGHDTQAVEKIMSNASAAVKGTAYGLGDAATVAASAVAAGVKPGQELQDVLTLVGDAASIAGTDMGSMGAIFNKVKASNKLQMDSINQLHDAGIPALALVADQLGVTAEEASAMASSGEIDFATFAAAMQEGMGGAAQKSGETFTGALANTRAALGRVGETMLTPFLAATTKALTSFAIPAIDAFNNAIKPFFSVLGVGLTAIVDAIAFTVQNFSMVTQAVSGVVGEIKAYWGDLYGFLSASDIQGAIMGAFNLSAEHPVVTWLQGAQRSAMIAYDNWTTAQGGFIDRLVAMDIGGAIWQGFDGSQAIADLSTSLSWATGLVEIAVSEWKAYGGDLYTFLAASDIPGIFATWFDFSMTDPFIMRLQEIQQWALRIYESFAGTPLAAIFTGILAAVTPVATAIGDMASSFMTALNPAIATLNGGFGALVTSALQLWQSLSPVSLIFQVMAPFAAQLGALLGTVVGVVIQLAAAIIPLGLQLASVLVPVLINLVGAILPALTQIIGAVVAILPQLVPLFAMVAQAVVQVISAVAPLVTQLVSALLPIIVQLVQAVLPMLMAAFNAVIPPILALVTAIVSNLVPVLQALLPAVTAIFSALAGIIEGAMGIISGIIQTVMGVITGNWGMAWDGIVAIFTGIWTWLVALVEAYTAEIVAILTVVFGTITALFTTTWEGIKQFFSNTWDALSSIVDTVLGGISSFIGDTLGSIASAWSEGWESIKRMLGDAWSAMESKVREVGGNIMQYLRDLPGRIKRIFAGAKDWLVESGRAMLAGFTDGIKKGFEKAKGAVEGGLNGIRRFFPSSPAKEGPFSGSGYTTYSGRALSRDFADAIASEADYLSRQSDRFMSAARMDAVAPAVPDYVPSSWSAEHGDAAQRITVDDLIAALSQVEVVMDGRTTVGTLGRTRRT